MASQDDSNSTILVAEDEESDVLILRRAFRNANLGQSLKVVADGSQVVNYLSGHAPFQNRAENPLPSLLLLDLKMPNMNGFEVLEWLGSQPQFKRLPVIVLSSSGHASDMEKALALGARDYRIKPLRFEAMVEMVQSIVGRWMNT
jgi:CheY-like chemotaxis protein